MKKETDLKIAFVLGRAQHQSDYAKLLSYGLKKHGITNIEFLTSYNHARYQADLVVLWAHKRTDVLNSGAPYLVMERAYLADRHHWVSLGFNGLNGRADFNNQDVTSLDRWNQHFKGYCKPWKTTGDYVLVCGQVPGDASHRHVDINTWYKTTINRLNKEGHNVVFRPHPLSRESTLNYISSSKFILDKNTRIEDTFKAAKACITFNSNAGVLSVLEGIPTVSCDIGSMAYDVTAHDVTNIDHRPKREKWKAKISHAQWLPNELETGVAWDHLRTALPRILKD